MSYFISQTEGHNIKSFLCCYVFAYGTIAMALLESPEQNAGHYLAIVLPKPFLNFAYIS